MMKHRVVSLVASVIGVLSLVMAPARSVAVPDWPIRAMSLWFVLVIIWSLAPSRNQKVIGMAATLGSMAAVPTMIFGVINTKLDSVVPLYWPLALACTGLIAAVSIAQGTFGGSLTTVQSGTNRQTIATGLLAIVLAVGIPFAVESVRVVRWLGLQSRVQTLRPPNNGEVLVNVFSDFLCPTCLQQSKHYDDLAERATKSALPGSVRVIHHYFPLDRSCNEGAFNDHPSSCEAAIVEMIAAEHGLSSDVRNALRQADQRDRAQALRAIEERFGLSQEVNSRRVELLGRLEQDIALGRQLNLKGADSVFVNGIRVANWSPELFERSLLVERFR